MTNRTGIPSARARAMNAEWKSVQFPFFTSQNRSESPVAPARRRLVVRPVVDEIVVEGLRLLDGVASSPPRAPSASFFTRGVSGTSRFVAEPAARSAGGTFAVRRRDRACPSGAADFARRTRNVARTSSPSPERCGLVDREVRDVVSGRVLLDGRRKRRRRSSRPGRPGTCRLDGSGIQTSAFFARAGRAAIVPTYVASTTRAPGASP